MQLIKRSELLNKQLLSRGKQLEIATCDSVKLQEAKKNLIELFIELFSDNTIDIVVENKTTWMLHRQMKVSVSFDNDRRLFHRASRSSQPMTAKR